MSNESGAPRPKRHSWEETGRFLHKTERTCRTCGVVKVTRHEGGEHWIEFWRGLEKLPDDRTPACEPAGGSA